MRAYIIAITLVHTSIMAVYSYICYTQSMDLRNPLIVLHKVASDRYFVQQTMNLFLNPWNGLPAQYILYAKYGLRRRDFILL